MNSIQFIHQQSTQKLHEKMHACDLNFNILRHIENLQKLHRWKYSIGMVNGHITILKVNQHFTIHQPLHCLLNDVEQFVYEIRDIITSGCCQKLLKDVDLNLL